MSKLSLILVAAYLLAVVFFYAVMGENSYIAIADNLDLFTPQYMILKNTGSFFAHGTDVPFLGGISRDNLPSEFNIVSVLYMLLPDFAAYVAMYVLKVIIAVGSFYLLGKEILEKNIFGKKSPRKESPDKEQLGKESPGKKSLDKELIKNDSLWERLRGKAKTKPTHTQTNILILIGFVYGIINFFPNFGIAFSSIPLILYLFLRIDALAYIQTSAYADEQTVWTKTALNSDKRVSLGHKNLFVYLGIFCYPLVSYFSYFGIFILGYTLLAFVFLSIKRKKFQTHIFAGLVVLALGYMLFEYRLFYVMLFGDTVTIRSSMKFAGYSANALFALIVEGLTQTSMHDNDVRRYFVLPVVLIYFVAVNLKRIFSGRRREIFHDVYNLCFAAVIFNCLVYALFYVGSFKSFIFALIPPLEGFQFDRTTFFNPFLLYAMLGIICVRLMNTKADDKTGITVQTPEIEKFEHRLSGSAADKVAKEYVNETSNANANIYEVVRHIAAYVLPLIAACVILATPTLYNDLRSTAAGTYRYLRTGTRSDAMSYGEFYSKDLFSRIKEDLDYTDEWSVAYGLYPAVLEYNGISTLDGYLGYYSQEYKEKFRDVIAPALDRVEANRVYFDDWGARCYLAFSTDSAVQLGTKSLQGLTDSNIYIDSAALNELGCTYVFSRIKITNADEMGLYLYRAYEDAGQAYNIYVYTLK